MKGGELHAKVAPGFAVSNGRAVMKTALVLACDDNFVAYASVVARRAARLSSEKFPIVIISDGVTDENKKLAQKFCSSISFIEASQMFGDSRFYQTELYTRATYLRLYLDEILADFDRITYIDGDMTPLVDIAPLLNAVPRAAPIMATYSFGHMVHLAYEQLPLARSAGYFQGGVQIYDLKAVRAERIFEEALQFAIKNPEKCKLVDQDALNVALQGRWQVLDWRWNVLNIDVQRFPGPFYIRHHGGHKKPWTPDKSTNEPYLVELWRSDLSESPWPQKFHAAKEPSFYRRHVRPITRAIEVGVKSAIRGESEESKHLTLYRQRLPGILKRVEAEARDGKVSQPLY